MAILNNIVGAKVWLKRKGFPNFSADQVIKVYIQVTGNKMKPIQSFSNRPNGDNSFQKFASWFSKEIKEKPELFRQISINNHDMKKLKEARIKLRASYL